jgi:S1-C subfamily serine protease
MERQQASWRGWAIMLLSCVLIVAAILLAARQSGIADGRKRAHDLLVIDTALGATLEPVEGGQHMVVTSVATGGPAAGAGIKVGDVIEQIDDRPAASTGEAAASLAASPATLMVNRNGNRATLRLPIRSAALAR